MEGLLNATAKAVGEGAEGADPWVQYMDQLREDDPQEYELVMQDIQDMVAAKENEKQDVAIRPQGAEGVADDDDNPARDPGASEFAPRLPGGKVMRGGGVQEAPDEEGVELKPTPAFVVKTRTVDGKDKIFVNVCHSELIQKMSTRKQLAVR